MKLVAIFGIYTMLSILPSCESCWKCNSINGQCNTDSKECSDPMPCKTYCKGIQQNWQQSRGPLVHQTWKCVLNSEAQGPYEPPFCYCDKCTVEEFGLRKAMRNCKNYCRNGVADLLSVQQFINPIQRQGWYCENGNWICSGCLENDGIPTGSCTTELHGISWNKPETPQHDAPSAKETPQHKNAPSAKDNPQDVIATMSEESHSKAHLLARYAVGKYLIFCSTITLFCFIF